MPGAQNYRLITLRSSNRKPLVVGDPGTAGASITIPPEAEVPAWADIRGARAWVAEARRLLSDEVLLRKLDEPRTGDVQQQFAQLRYLFLVGNAIANVYNMLNIPWCVHPTARALYRRFIAGPPAVSGNAGTKYALYRKTNEYNTNWYVAENDLPLTERPRSRNARLFRGELPGLGEGLFNQYYQANENHPREFVQCAGLWLDVASSVGGAGGAPREMNTTTAPDVYNRAFAVIGELFQTDPEPEVARRLTTRVGAQLPLVTRFPTGIGIEPKTGERVPLHPPRGHFEPQRVLTQAFDSWSDLRAERIDSTLLRRGGSNALVAADWRTFAYDEALSPGTKLMFATPPREYLRWYRAWVAALEGEMMRQVVFNARAFVVLTNQLQVQLNGNSAQAFLAGVMGQDAEVETAINAPDPAAQAVAAGLTAAGATVSAFGPYGAVAGLILGVAAMATRIGDALFDKPLRNDVFKRDDLGRIKPVLERSWLSGVPIEGNVPGIEVPAPPGYDPRAGGGTGGAARLAMATGITRAAWSAMPVQARFEYVRGFYPEPGQSSLVTAMVEALDEWADTPLRVNEREIKAPLGGGSGGHGLRLGTTGKWLLAAGVVATGAVIAVAVMRTKRPVSRVNPRRNKRRTHVRARAA